MSKAKEIFNDIHLTNQIINLMVNANKIIMEIYDSTSKKVIIKENNTPVTEADLAANKFLTQGLEKIFPNIPIVSEENEDSLSIPQKHNIFSDKGLNFIFIIFLSIKRSKDSVIVTSSFEFS